FTYLLRYVEDSAATLRELVRVVRPGGTIASLEFGLPRGLSRPFWEAYVRAVLPVAGRAMSADWARVGAFLGDSIRAFYERWPSRRLQCRRRWESSLRFVAPSGSSRSSPQAACS